MEKLVFVVDDERCIADTLAVILGRAGYKAEAFYDATSALVRCESCTPDLVISDVVMPGMNGVEMAVTIRERHPACKILLFSGQANTMGFLESVGKHGYEFEVLAKPIHPADLLAKVSSLGEHAEVKVITTHQEGLDHARRFGEDSRRDQARPRQSGEQFD